MFLLLFLFASIANAASHRILVLNPKGEQEIMEVQDSGGYNFPDRVIWDERKDGPFPKEMVLGAMKKSGSSLVVDKDMWTTEQARLAELQKAQEKAAADKAAMIKIRQDLVSKLKQGIATNEEVQEFLSLDL